MIDAFIVIVAVLCIGMAFELLRNWRWKAKQRDIQREKDLRHERDRKVWDEATEQLPKD